MKILSAVLSVSTTLSERKTYLRNSTLENRLVGLALMNIHRNTSIITDDAVLKKFAHGGRARSLQLILLMYLFCNKYFVYDII